MVPQEGLELSTRGLGNRCSIHLSYWGINLSYYTVNTAFCVISFIVPLLPVVTLTELNLQGFSGINIGALTLNVIALDCRLQHLTNISLLFRMPIVGTNITWPSTLLFRAVSTEEFI
jgi:hypothetical protein